MTKVLLVGLGPEVPMPTNTIDDVPRDVQSVAPLHLTSPPLWSPHTMGFCGPPRSQDLGDVSQLDTNWNLCD